MTQSSNVKQTAESQHSMYKYMPCPIKESYPISSIVPLTLGQISDTLHHLIHGTRACTRFNHDFDLVDGIQRLGTVLDSVIRYGLILPLWQIEAGTRKRIMLS